MASPILNLYITPRSLIIGFLAGLIVSTITIWIGLRNLRRVSVRQLLAGEVAPAGAVEKPSKNRASRTGQASRITTALVAGSIGLAFYAMRLGGEAQAGAFLGAGGLMLVALLRLIARQLKAGGQTRQAFRGGALVALAMRNAGRSVGRSTTTIALMGSASFLVVAVSAFRLSPSAEGVGGFDLLAESAQPIIADLNSAAGRRELLAGDAAKLDGTTVLSLRLRPGDDASCRNLYEPSQPRMLGVTPAFIQHFDDPRATHFEFAASAAAGADQKANPWRLLTKGTPADEPIHVVLDKNTAMYSLRLYQGVGEEFKRQYNGRDVHFRVVGLLSNSVLQGSLLVSEADFTRLFPQISGYRSFLIDAPPQQMDAVAALLEDKLGDEGFDTTSARARLADLLAVQNAYISTFQSLGGLGLLLGTFGLAAVQLRSIYERRKELALLRAAGFRRTRLAEMVLLENLLLLVGGLGAGTVAAVVAIVPHMLSGGAHVPLGDLLLMLGIVLAVGILTGLIAVRATLHAPLVAALRGE
jgi:hypothetical protein